MRPRAHRVEGPGDHGTPLVRSCWSGPGLAEALARLDARPGPDVVLLDVDLPHTTGRAPLDHLLEEHPGTPVVVLTEPGDDEGARAAMEAGAQDYLVRDTATSDAMVRAVRHAIDRHQLVTALRERTKETATLYAVSQVLHRDVPPGRICAEVAARLAEGMQWPRHCHARVEVDDVHESVGPSVARDDTALRAEVVVEDTVRGRVMVGYDRPDRPFLLPEERDMVDAVADAVSGWLRRQDALRRLSREEERLRLLVTQLPGTVWTTDTHLRITSYAGAWLAAIGVADDRFIGRPVAEVLDPGSPDKTMTLFEAALAGRPTVFERHWRGRWWRNHLEPQHAADGEVVGEVVGTVCLTLDVTSEKDQEAELEATRDRLAGVFTHASDAMLLADDTGAYVDANPAACVLTGRDRSQLLGMHPWELAAGNPLPTEAESGSTWGELQEDGTLAGEFAVRRSDGAVVLTEFRAVANIVPGIHLSTLRDVTDRRRAEEALADSEGRFRAMAESAQDAIYRLRFVPEPTFDYLNPAVEELSGFTLQALHDNPMLYLERAHADDVHHLDPTNLGPDITSTVRIRFRRADDSWIWLEDRRTPIIEDGTTVGVQGVMRDVTAQEQADRALREALAAERRAADRLRAIDDLKSSFLQAVSHELRTPLTSVLGYARTLATRAEVLTPEQVHDFHHRLATNAGRLDTLLGDLLDIERLDQGTVRLHLQPVDLTSLARQVADTVDVGDRRVVIDESSSIAVVDAPKVQRVVHNLLANASKHTPTGTTIWITCRAGPETATITVADDGPGIDESDHDLVFEPFWQAPTERTPASPGTGIGLALVRRFTELHGGHVSVGTRPGGGIQFVVSLPTGDPGARPETSTRLVPATTATETVEGELAFHDLMRETVHQFDAATSSDEATGVVLRFVQRAGARLVRVDDQDPETLDIDLSLDRSQLLRAAAPVGSQGRRRLQHHLPFVLEHARGHLAPEE